MSNPDRTHLILVGGFLGAGKTTLLLAAAQQLTGQGLRVGLVTNDQGADLVDTALVAHRAMPVVEVAGGCFCCRFPDLLAALETLYTQVRPDVVIAEPVGSCTDLMATVLLPLERYHSDRFTLAPLTVLDDPTRPLPDPASPVAYLRTHQLAEAEIIAVNKLDRLAPAAAAAHQAELAAAFPHAEIAPISALTGTGVDRWLAQMMASQSKLARVLDIDYTTYAEAEAALAWLNAKVVLRSGQPFVADKLIATLLQGMAAAFAAQGAAIAHLKLHLHAPGVELKGSVTATGQPVYWDQWQPGARADRAQLLVNARVEAPPAAVEQVVRGQIEQVTHAAQVRGEITHFECFQPAPPQPTHRLAV